MLERRGTSLGGMRMVYGVWCMVYGVWYMVYGAWCMVCGVWCMVYGVWCGAKAFLLRAAVRQSRPQHCPDEHNLECDVSFLGTGHLAH